jgi:hypothetical protein
LLSVQIEMHETVEESLLQKQEGGEKEFLKAL